MKTMTRQIYHAIGMTVLAIALGGCQSGSSDHAASLAGKSTFTVADVIGGGQSAVAGTGSGASDAVRQTIQATFEQHGYTYKAQGPADLNVTAAWQYSMSTNPNYIQTQIGTPQVTPTSLQRISINIVARDGKTGDIVWRGVTPLPITTSTMTPGMATSLAQQALRGLPDMQAEAPAPAKAN
jgi:hypothetical protein